MRKNVQPNSQWPGRGGRRQREAPQVEQRLCTRGGRRGLWVSGCPTRLSVGGSEGCLRCSSSQDGYSGCKQAWSGARQWATGHPGNGCGEGEGSCVLRSPSSASFRFILQTCILSVHPASLRPRFLGRGRDARYRGCTWPCNSCLPLTFFISLV